MMLRILLAMTCAGVSCAFGASVHLLQKPALSKTQIVFSYAGDLWTVSRQGGVATRLTAGTGVETEPVFSPDGATLAFTGEYDGNIDVFTVPAAGGVPKRITYHPEADRVMPTPRTENAWSTCRWTGRNSPRGSRITWPGDGTAAARPVTFGP
ncbi:MAG: hypothetical protein LAQ30_07720 [Acidobacteriia bacterium]|nr:hypothetical protein [Terriglobia bacterium]